MEHLLAERDERYQLAERLAYSIEDAALVSGIGRTKLFEYIKLRRLKARKAGRRTIITHADLQSLIDSLPVREIA